MSFCQNERENIRQTTEELLGTIGREKTQKLLAEMFAITEEPSQFVEYADPMPEPNFKNPNK